MEWKATAYHLAERVRRTLRAQAAESEVPVADQVQNGLPPSQGRGNHTSGDEDRASVAWSRELQYYTSRSACQEDAELEHRLLKARSLWRTRSRMAFLPPKAAVSTTPVAMTRARRNTMMEACTVREQSRALTTFHARAHEH